MSSSINLVEKRSEERDKAERTRKLRKISFTLLFSTAFLSLVMFLLSYRFSIGYVKGQEDKLLRKMTVYEDLSAKVFLLNNRLSDVNSLLSSRSKLNARSQSILDVKPEGLAIGKFQIDGAGAVIEASSSKLSDVNDFLNSLLGLVDDNKISAVTIDSLSANSNGYSIKILAN